jgi:CubicO group peptidase (beta-lactamase class C family)
MMTDLSARIDAALASALNEKRIVGAVIIVMKDGEIAHRRAYGLADREAGVAMKPDAIFRLASISKPIVTAAAMRMIEQKQLSLGAAVTDWLPDFKPKLPDGSQPAITIRHLLTHTAGLSYDFMQMTDGPYHQHRISSGADQDGLSMEENLQRITAAGLAFQPGAMWVYSVAIDVLGAVMQKAANATLPDIVARLVTQPLGMKDTAFHVVDKDRLVQPYSNAPAGPIRIPEVFKQPFLPGLAPISFTLSRAFDSKGFPSGGAGMIGAADDIARFLDTIRSGGGPIVSPDSARAMMSNQIGDLRILFDPTGSTAFGFGGAIMLDPAKAASPLSPGAWYWGGVWGHSWFVQPARQTTIVCLTNTTLEGMSGQLPGDLVKAVAG